YCPDETGPVELLGKRLAVITDPPVLTDKFSRGDIVRLDQSPHRCNGCPRVEKVIHTRFPRRTRIRFTTEREDIFLHSLFLFLEAQVDVLWGPSDKGPGMMMVSHPVDVDPIAIAKALGIQQEYDRKNLDPDGGSEDAPRS